MKYVFYLYCIFIWGIAASISTRFIIEDGKPKVQISKYVEQDNFTETVSPQTDNLSNETNDSFAGETAKDDSSTEGNTTQGNKRFIHHLYNSYNQTEIPDTTNFTIYGAEFWNCSKITIDPGNYEMLPNRSVHVPQLKRLFDIANYVIKQSRLLVCPSFSVPLQEKFPSNIGTISIVGTSISATCIILHMIMFFTIEKMRNLPGYCLLSLCISLLTTYTVSLVQYNMSDDADCKVIGLFMMYSLLSSFFWMNIMSFDILHMVRTSTSEVRPVGTHRKFVRFASYSLYAWGMPALIMVLAVIVDNVSESVEYQLIFRITTCWFQYKKALFFYFALPVFILIVANLFLFITSFIMIRKSRLENQCQDAYSLKSQLFMSLRLFSAMGLVWVLGLIAPASQVEWLQYLYSLFTALQGVFIFFSFTINRDTQRAWQKALERKKTSDEFSVSQRTKPQELLLQTF